MEGAVELAEEVFQMPVRLGAPYGMTGLVDVVQDPIYASCVGLLQYGRGRLAGDFDRPPPAPLPPIDGFKPSSGNTWLLRLKRWIRDNL